LTLDVGSDQATEQPPFVSANFVPIAVSGHCRNRPFAAMAQVAKAAFQIPSLFSLT